MRELQRQKAILEDLVVGVLAPEPIPDRGGPDDRLVVIEMISDDLVQLAEQSGHKLEQVDKTEVDFVKIDLESVDINGASTGGADECAVTHPFARYSLPYERIDIEPLRDLGRRRPRSTTYVRTVPGRRTFDPKWYDLPEVALVAIEEPEPMERVESWVWLWISLAVGGLAVLALALASM